MAAKEIVSQAKVDGTHTGQIYGSPSELDLENSGGLGPAPESG